MELKEINQILGQYTRDLVNQNVGLQTRIVAFEKLRDAVAEAATLNIDGLRQEAAALKSQIAKQQKQVEATQSRSDEVLGSYKSKMLEVDAREKAVASREAECAAREQKVAQREEKARAIAGHLATFSESDS